jgi:hypothetical protein
MERPSGQTEGRFYLTDKCCKIMQLGFYSVIIVLFCNKTVKVAKKIKRRKFLIINGLLYN